MSETPLVRAFFVRQTDPGKGKKFEVHFNPASLLYEITNTLDDKGSGNKTKQYVSQSTGKLTMDLVFDTTHDGQDVRIHTEKIAKFMQPEDKTPPVVSFEWGAYKFQGTVETYKETIDFFSAEGVPLRAQVNLAMSSQDKVFTSGKNKAADTGGALSAEGVEVDAPEDGGAADLGNPSGDSQAARDLAAFNGQESLRFSDGASFVVGGEVPLGAPVAFASGGASGGIGFGIGGGFEAGISGGFGVSGGFDAGASFSAGAGATFGSRASARVTASAGAFAGLRPPSLERVRSPRLRAERFLERPDGSELGTDEGAKFQLGGQASLQAPVSLGADVGASASLRSRMRFDED